MSPLKIFFLGYLLLSANLLQAQAPDWVWATNGGGNQVEYSRCVTTDPMGNVYIIGTFEGNAQFAGHALASSGMADVFLAKYDSLGTLRWIRQGGGRQVEEGFSIAADAAGNCYVSGAFRDTAVFDGDTLVSTNTFDMFFARYDSSGTLSWLKKVGNSSYGGGVSTDNDGHVFLTGRFQGTGVFDTTVLVALGGNGIDAFIAQFDSAGAVQWARKAGSVSIDQCFGSSTDSGGNTYLVGEFTGTATFDSLQLTSAGPYGSIFIVKYDHNGNALWVNRGTSTDIINGYSIGADPAGNCYVSGLFRDTILFDTVSLINPSATALNVFLVRFDSTGHATWANRAYCSNFIDGRSLAVDANGDCYISGFFAGTSTFGPLSMYSTLGFADAFVAKYDAGGAVEWIQKGGGNASESDAVIALDAQANVYVTGRYSASNSLFGTHALPYPAGSADVFLARLGSTLATNIALATAEFPFLIYPNPAMDLLKLDGLPRHDQVFLSVTDMTGRKLLELETNSFDSHPIHIAFLAPGLYILQIQTREGSYSARFIKR